MPGAFLEPALLLVDSSMWYNVNPPENWDLGAGVTEIDRDATLRGMMTYRHPIRRGLKAPDIDKSPFILLARIDRARTRAKE